MSGWRPIARGSDGCLDVDKIWPFMPYERRQAIGPWICEDSHHFNWRAYRLMREGINAGELAGAEAFAVVDAFGLPQVHHGSRVLPEDLEDGVLKPRQTYWRDPAGRLYRDGPPAVCFTEDRPTAVCFALLNPQLPLESDNFFGCVRAAGRLWLMTTANTLEAAEGRAACVYMAGKTFVPRQDMGPARDPEHRSTEPLDYEFAVRVGCTALPPDLLVIDAGRDLASYIYTEVVGGAHPLDLTFLADIEPLGGEWLVEDHPALRGQE